MIEERLNQHLKQALLAGDRFTTNTLRSLKSAILYAKVANGSSRDEPMADSLLFGVLQKEAKKRQESADLYRQGKSEERAESELAEKRIIEQYLPAQLDASKIAALVDESVEELGGVEKAPLGIVIGKVKERAAGSVDGALVARIVKERLRQ